MKLYMIQIHHNRSDNKDGIYLFEKWENCLAEYKRIYDFYINRCKMVLDNKVAISDEESEDCETQGMLKVVNKNNSITTCYVMDYHLLDN